MISSPATLFLWRELALLALFVEEVAVGTIDEGFLRNVEQLQIPIALLLELLDGNAAVFVDGLYFDKGTQAFDLIDVKFYIVDEVNGPSLVHLHPNAQCLFQGTFECGIICGAIERNVRQLGASLVGALVVNEGTFDPSLAEFQAAIGDDEVGIHLVVFSLEPGVVFHERLSDLLGMWAVGFDFDDSGHEGKLDETFGCTKGNVAK